MRLNKQGGTIRNYKNAAHLVISLIRRIETFMAHFVENLRQGFFMSVE
jgi:hypothetical protein